MTLGDVIEVLCAAYAHYPWTVRSYLVSRVVDAVTDGAWGEA